MVGRVGSVRGGREARPIVGRRWTVVVHRRRRRVVGRTNEARGYMLHYADRDRLARGNENGLVK